MISKDHERKRSIPLLDTLVSLWVGHSRVAEQREGNKKEIPHCVETCRALDAWDPFGTLECQKSKKANFGPKNWVL